MSPRPNAHRALNNLISNIEMFEDRLREFPEGDSWWDKKGKNNGRFFNARTGEPKPDETGEEVRQSTIRLLYDFRYELRLRRAEEFKAEYQLTDEDFATDHWQTLFTIKYPEVRS